MHYNPKILCLYSGGLDSAGALWQLIHDPNYIEYEILIHHVHLINATKRYNAEKQAVDKSIPIFCKYTNRKLYFSSTIMDFAFMAPKVPMDADVYGFVAANLANIDLSIKYIAIGRTLDDKNSGGSSFVQIVNCVEKAVLISNYGRETSTTVQCITPVVELTKQQIWEMLPADIRDATWSCRTPRYNIDSSGKVIASACMNCHACLARVQLE